MFSTSTGKFSFKTIPLFVLAVSALFGQTYQGGVRGTITDAQGASVADAKVTLTNAATSVSRDTLSNSSGEYVFNTVDPATYKITAVAPSFKTFERDNVVIATQQFLTVDVKLDLGSVTQSVMVTDEVPVVDNATASNGQVMDSQKLTDLPNLGRNPFLLSKLSTNVEPVGDPRFNRFQDQSGSSQISIGGGPVRGNNYLIDGVPITDSENRAVIIPSIEGTQEMKLQENTYDATMGRTGGGVFNTLLKSGTNDPHFSLFGYTRQTDWLANNFFYNANGTPRPDTPFYNWGGSFGGPVWIPKVYNGKNKTFFWLVTESYRQKSPESDGYVVPTALERTGNFASSATTIYDPATTRPCTAADHCPAGISTVRSPFPGNVIPSNRINPIGASLLSYFPNPNTLSTRTNYQGNDILTDRADEYMAKVDHELLSWWKLNASYLHYKSREPGGNTLGTLPGGSPSNGNASPYLLYRKVDATQVNSVMTVNPTTVVSLRFGFNRFPNLTEPYSAGFDPALLGFPASFTSGLQSAYFPEMDFNSSSLSTVSPVNSVFYSRNFLASVSKYLGRHSLTFGFDYRGIHTDFTNLNYSAGDFKFNGAFTEQFPNVAGSGSDFADALLGYPYQGEVDTTTKLFLHVNYFSGYIQDDFRVNSKLTLNLGLRYEYETGISEDNNHLVVGFNGLALNPLAANVTGITPRGAVEYAGVNGNSTSCCNPSAKKFGPRIGVAYSLNDKTVIRGGFGIFYAPTRFADDPGMALGYTQATTYVASNNGNATPANSLSNPFPGGVLQPQGNARGALAGVGSSFNFLDQGRGSGEVLQYSVDVQRQLPSNIALEVGYIGSSSRHLQDSSTGTGAYNINQVPDSALALGSQLSSPVANPYFQNGGTGVIGSPTVTNAQLLKPYSPFSTIGILTNPSYALYNSMIVKAQKRLSAGLTFLSAFTWSKNMDNEFAGTNFFSGSSTAPQDAYNLAAEYSLAVADTPLRWSNTVSYYLPFGKGKMFLNKSKLVDYAVGGWQVNFTNIYQSGFPLAISQSSNQNSILGTAVQRPNATGASPSMSGSVEQRLNGYINSAAFSSAPIYTFGNLARTIPYRGPGMKNWDISLFKNFAITEKFNAEFRAEALNAFNSPLFPNPNTKFGSSSFGTITSQVNFSRMLQLGVRFFF